MSTVKNVKHNEMKTLLKSFKNYKEAFSVPEPDADFEKRILKSLHDSQEWKKTSIWSKLNEKMEVFRFEMTAFRLAGSFAMVLLLLGSLRYWSPTHSQFVNVENKRSHPELHSMLQRGGEKALQAWIMINGDMSTASSLENVEKAPLSTEEQKRILAELEKKWAPAL